MWDWIGDSGNGETKLADVAGYGGGGGDDDVSVALTHDVNDGKERNKGEMDGVDSEDER